MGSCKKFVISFGFTFKKLKNCYQILIIVMPIID